jgi:sporulation protein YlmC with PRC-barrel domain
MREVDIDTALEWRGRTVVDRAGEKVGTLKDIYLDEDQRPHWGAVHTGLFGLRETLVPLAQARPEEDLLRVPFDRDHVQNAPHLDPDVQLSADEEQQLYRHYGLTTSQPGDSTDPGAVAAGTDPDDSVAEETGGDAMTRSEEVVRFGKRQRMRGRARLKKYVVTDYVEKKVPVQREEVRLEYEPTGEPENERPTDGEPGPSR